MAAFNWIEFIEMCPVCSERTSIRAQVHIGASFEGADEGRFCNVTYSVGDKMRWWDKDRLNYEDWVTDGARVPGASTTVRECCYATCGAHGDRLYAVVEISDLVVEKVIEIGPEDQWPFQYSK